MVAHCCCWGCALCQDAREIRYQLFKEGKRYDLMGTDVIGPAHGMQGAQGQEGQEQQLQLQQQPKEVPVMMTN